MSRLIAILSKSTRADNSTNTGHWVTISCLYTLLLWYWITISSLKWIAWDTFWNIQNYVSLPYNCGRRGRRRRKSNTYVSLSRLVAGETKTMPADLLPLECAHLLNVFYLPMTFCANRPYGFKVMLRTKMASDWQTNRQTDTVTPIYPPKTSFFFRYNNDSFVHLILANHNKFHKATMKSLKIQVQKKSVPLMTI